MTEEIILQDGETEEDATVSHDIEDRPDPDSLAGEEVDDSDLWDVDEEEDNE